MIATIYTKDHGKIKGVFKAFHTPKKEFTTSLDLFTLNEFVFYPKKRELWLVSFADQIADYPYLRGDYTKNSVATLCFGVVDRIMPVWDVNIEIFDLLAECLIRLAKEDPFKVLYIFLIKLLTISGFEPEFGHCLRCHRDLEGRVYFSVTRGGLLCSRCTPGITDARLVRNDVFLSMRYVQGNDFSGSLRLKTTMIVSAGCFISCVSLLCTIWK